MDELELGGASPGGLPWAFVLDPAANARALGEVQRRGLRAAREIVERIMSSIDPGEDIPTAPTPMAWRTETRQSESTGDLLSTWWTLTIQALAAMAAAVGNPKAGPEAHTSPTDSLSIDITADAVPASWRLRVDCAGQLLDPAELWLRNPSTEPAGPLRLDVSDLRTVEGRSLPARCLRCDPAVVAELPARSARGVIVTLAVPVPLEPGNYRGVMQIEGAPRVCVALEVVVDALSADGADLAENRSGDGAK